jgi:hypothetical protein
VREFRSRGSVRGAVGNDRPYRELGGASCRSSHVRNTPLATVGPKRRPVVMGHKQAKCVAANSVLFNHFVGNRKERRRDV